MLVYTLIGPPRVDDSRLDRTYLLCVCLVLYISSEYIFVTLIAPPRADHFSGERVYFLRICIMLNL